jgi:hypothetical protein
MSDDDRGPDGRFVDGNRASFKHGREAAVRALTRGDEFTGVAHKAELAVYEDLEAIGPLAIATKGAARLQAASDLFWDAIDAAIQNQDLTDLDHVMARFGWLQGAALRAWKQVMALMPDNGDVLDYEEMLRENGHPADQ